MASRIHFLVKGEVQGIGYRFFVIEHAERLRLDGWVRNLPDGDVEGEAEGEAAALDAFLSELKGGHPWARVTGVETRPAPPQGGGERGFRITR